MKLFNPKPLNKMNRDELIDLILNTGTEKYLKGNIDNEPIENLRKVASIAHVGEKGMTGGAKFFFYFGAVLFVMFIISLIRAHWIQSVVELLIAILMLGASSFLHVRKGKKAMEK